MAKRNRVQAQVVFLYYRDLDAAAAFFTDVMGFELVEDQGFAKIYRTGGNAFVGAVTGERGFHQPREKNAVTVTLAVEDVSEWHEYLTDHGVKMLTELEHSPGLQVQGFFFEDPGGYVFEVQRFLKPELADVFHGL